MLWPWALQWDVEQKEIYWLCSTWVSPRSKVIPEPPLGQFSRIFELLDSELCSACKVASFPLNVEKMKGC